MFLSTIFIFLPKDLGITGNVVVDRIDGKNENVYSKNSQIENASNILVSEEENFEESSLREITGNAEESNNQKESSEELEENEPTSDEENTTEESENSTSQQDSSQENNSLSCPNSCPQKSCSIGYCNFSSSFICKYLPITNCCGNSVCETGESFTHCSLDCEPLLADFKVESIWTMPTESYTSEFAYIYANISNTGKKAFADIFVFLDGKCIKNHMAKVFNKNKGAYESKYRTNYKLSECKMYRTPLERGENIILFGQVFSSKYKPSSSINIPFIDTGKISSTKEIEIIVDYLGDITEYNESNNYMKLILDIKLSAPKSIVQEISHFELETNIYQIEISTKESAGTPLKSNKIKVEVLYPNGDFMRAYEGYTNQNGVFSFTSPLLENIGNWTFRSRITNKIIQDEESIVSYTISV